MAGVQTIKTLLHASAVDGKQVHRWVVAAFPDVASASMFAGLIKSAHAGLDWDRVKTLDPSAALGSDGVPLTPVKLSATTVPYSPHKSVGSGLDVD
jgi:hypothetical protein